jgi:hypothetical protein
MTPNSTPYIHRTGDTMISFNADSKYYFWNGGQHLSDTLSGLSAPQDVWDMQHELNYRLYRISHQTNLDLPTRVLFFCFILFDLYWRFPYNQNRVNDLSTT